MAVKNAQDGISLIQTAEGALTESHAILQRMRELAVQSANDTNTLDDRKELQKELNELIDELDRIADNTEFNTKKLLHEGDDTSTKGFVGKFQIGANSDQAIDVEISSMKTKNMGAATVGSIVITDLGTLKVTTLDAIQEGTGDDKGILTYLNADAAIVSIDKAIQTVSAERSKLGAFQNRLEHTIKNLGVASENLAAAESRIRDVDMASEMMNFTKQNILMQAGTAMLAQANARPQSVLQLLG
jgi:flagellin